MKYINVLQSLFLIFFIIKDSYSYTASGGQAVEYQGIASKDFPNEYSANVTVFKQITFRIEPDLINGYNEKTTRIEIKASIEAPKHDGNLASQFPLFVSLVHRHDHMLMKLPYIFSDRHGQETPYYSASRSICLPKTRPDAVKNDILVTVSTGSAVPIKFMILVLVQDNLILPFNKTTNFTISPTAPKFIFFPFLNDTKQNLVLKVSSNNTNCMRVDVQEPGCPALTSDDKLIPGKDWKVVSQNSKIEINMRKYLKGFYVKFSQFGDDVLCGDLRKSTGIQRRKNVSIIVEYDPLYDTSKEGYLLIAVGFPPLFSFLVGLVTLAVYCISYCITRKRIVVCRTQMSNKAESNRISLQTFTLSGNSRRSNYGKLTLFISLFFVIPIVEQSIYNGLEKLEFMALALSVICAHTRYGFSKILIIFGAIFVTSFWDIFSYKLLGSRNALGRPQIDEGVQFYPGLYYSMGLGLIVKGIASGAHHFCPSKSNFHYDTAYVSVIFAICILKLVELRRPKCINPNSACGWLIICFLISTLGVAFERYFDNDEIGFFVFRVTIASIQGIFLFYATIYIIYIGYPITRFPQARRKEDIPLQNMVIKELRHKQTSVTISGPSSKSQSKLEEVPMIPPHKAPFPQENVMKTIGDIPRFLWIFPKIWHWKLPKFQIDRLIFVILFLTLNSGLIYYSLVANYSLYVLLSLVSNFGLNFFFYFIMKMFLGEFTCKWKSIQVFFYIFIAVGFATASGVFFWKNLAELGGPESGIRDGDAQCLLTPPFSFYDKHDAWHMLSAHALFFVFMILLSIDDGVEGVDREYLLVF